MCGEPVPSIQSDVKIALDCRDRKYIENKKEAKQSNNNMDKKI